MTNIQPCDFFCPQVSLILVVTAVDWPGDSPARKEALDTRHYCCDQPENLQPHVSVSFAIAYLNTKPSVK